MSLKALLRQGFLVFGANLGFKVTHYRYDCASQAPVLCVLPSTQMASRDYVPAIMPKARRRA
jgi:hypothetical protein